jgi:polyhydroxyalkanoate synthase
VRLLEWLPASKATSNNVLNEYMAAIGECVAKIPAAKPVLMGHSLGGTLAALYGAVAPRTVNGLVLIGAPLCFRRGISRFWDTLASFVPLGLTEAEPFPGSLISQVAMLASPRTFIWQRIADVALSLANGLTLEAHARVERWTLDECPLPGKLVHQIIEWLCRENRFYRGSLQIGDTLIGPGTLSVPTLAVVNAADEIAPLASVRPFIDAMATKDVSIIKYPGEFGVGLQHLATLIGEQARVHLWPKIISWADAHCGPAHRSSPGEFSETSAPKKSDARLMSERA